MQTTRDFGGLISAFILGIFFAIIWLIAWAIVGSITKPIMILGWVFIGLTILNFVFFIINACG